MRTKPPRILPGCVYCDFDHDPAIECRFQGSGRFWLNDKPKPKPQLWVLRDAAGKIIASGYK